MNTSRDSGSGDGMTSTIGGYIYAIPTGVEGQPRPTSTVVKQLTAPEAPPAEDETTRRRVRHRVPRRSSTQLSAPAQPTARRGGALPRPGRPHLT